MTFNRGTTRDAAKVTNTLNKLARHVGTHAWSQSTVAGKVMIELVEPVSEAPTQPVRKYYLAVPDNEVTANPRTQTNDRFEVGSLIENINDADNIE